MDDIYTQMALRIIDRQQAVIGPVALEQAMQVSDMAVNWAKRTVSFFGDRQAAIDDLVQRYEELFGQVSVEVCRDAVADLLPQLPPEKQPKSLL